MRVKRHQMTKTANPDVQRRNPLGSSADTERRVHGLTGPPPAGNISGTRTGGKEPPTKVEFVKKGQSQTHD